MEENQNMSMEVDAEESLFDSAEDLFENDDGNQTEEASETEEESAEEQEQAQEQSQEEEEQNAGGAEDWYDLKHLKETKRVNRKEVMELAQQGLDYKRVSEQRDALRNALQEQTNWRAQNEGILSDLQTVAEASGQDVGEFMRALRINSLMKRENLTRGEAGERVLREEAEKKLNAREQADLSRQQAAMQQTRAQKEIQAFAGKYPDVDVKTIPQEVFRRAASGETSLIGAYAEHLNGQLHAEIQKLQAELAAEKQNKTNKQKSVGSARTEGANTKFDDFMSGFNE